MYHVSSAKIPLNSKNVLPIQVNNVLFVAFIFNTTHSQDKVTTIYLSHKLWTFGGRQPYINPPRTEESVEECANG